MIKKIFCGILSASVLFSAFPMTALANDDPTILTNGFDFRNKKENLSGNGWEWNAEDLTLTLDGFRVTAPVFSLDNYEPVLSLPDESTLYIKGDNNLIEALSHYSDAIHCEGELLICGTGKLEILTTYTSNAIFCDRGPLTLEDSVEITVTPEDHVIYIDDARGRNPVLSILDEAKVIFPNEHIMDDAILVTHRSNVTPAENWMNFSSEYDDFSETVTLLAKAEEETPVISEEPALPEEPVKNEYKLTIGSGDIMKNNVLSHTADTAPYLSKTGYTMLPLRALLAVSDPELEITWIAETKSAHTFVNDKLVTIRPNEATYQKATDKIALLTPAETKNGRLFISLRDWMNIMEIEDAELNWDKTTKTVTLTY